MLLVPVLLKTAYLVYYFFSSQNHDLPLHLSSLSTAPLFSINRITACKMTDNLLRIKDVRRRPRAGTPTGGGGGSSFSGPFSSLDPNTVSSPSASQQPMANGFSFGQSQSFPSASPAPKPPTQNGGSQFAFGSGGGSSAFNFSASFGGASSTPASNPFASINTGGASQQPAASNFSGFKGDMFNAPSSGSQTPTQQSLPSGGIFGAGSQQNGPTGGLFGNTGSSGPSSQSGTATPANGSIFGQSTAAPSTNAFGQSTENKTSSFAPTASFGSDSMQTSPDAKSSAQKPPAFGSSSTGFGVSTNFGSSGAGNPFGGANSTPSQTPSKPLFGAKSTDQAAPATPALFGAASQSTPSASAAPSSSAAPFTTSAPTPSLFSAATPKPATETPNPFQSKNIFGAPTSSTPQKSSDEKEKDEKKDSQPTLFQSSFNPPSAPSGPSLFSKSAGATSTQSTGPSQPVSTGSLFAPKTSSSTERETPQAAEGNPFSSLFAPKTAAADSPKPEQSKPEQKPSQFASNMFAPKPSSDEGATSNAFSKAATSASPFTASTLGQPSSPAPQSPAFSFSKPQATSSAPAFGTPTASQSPFQANKAKPATPAAPASTSTKAAQSFEKLQPSKLPSDLNKNTKEEVEMAHRVRLLNESFQREVAKLNTSTDSFDAIVQFYLRVRETIGAPIEGSAGTKRKASVDSAGTNDSHQSKKDRPFGDAEESPAAQSQNNTRSSQSFGTPSASNKRKASEDNDDASSSKPAKRVSGDSTTANIFANSFSRSKTSETDEPAASPRKSDASTLKPSTPESAKPSLFSTTPNASPPKPAFNSSATPKETPTSSATPAQASTFKPSFTAPSSGNPPANPFVLKPSSDAGASTSAAPSAIPKFGSSSGSGTTDFFAQFKANSDKEAEKEKKKRKAEDFDSDEDDEAEWERKDAEAQRKKREEIEAQQNKRAKFVPGQGFSFEETTTTEENSDGSRSSSVLDSKPNLSEKSSNIFGHLSATPSENGQNGNDDDADDTEEASVSGDDAGKESSFAPTEDLGTSRSDSKSNGVESSDEGDFAKALKKSKQAETPNEQTSEEQGSGGRSLFDRVEYNEGGKPRRQGENDKNASSLFGSSKFASSFSSSAPTPNPFSSPKPQSGNPDGNATPKPATTNFLGASTSTPNPFGGSTFASPDANTPSIFAPESSASKPGSDNTWKLNTPIKFASESTSAPAKSEAESAVSASGSSNSFPALFGPSSGAQSSSGNAQTAPGFSFGGPSEAGLSLQTPSALTSGTPSRASTPGANSELGAEGSADGDAAEKLPQVDLSRGGAGEEDEDVIIEARSRGLKLIDNNWISQGVGLLRILKNRKTSRSRVLLRADPSGNVLLNAILMKEIHYKLQGTGIYFPVFKAEGPPEQWALRLKKPDSEQVGGLMEEHKS